MRYRRCAQSAFARSRAIGSEFELHRSRHTTDISSVEKQFVEDAKPMGIAKASSFNPGGHTVIEPSSRRGAAANWIQAVPYGMGTLRFWRRPSAGTDW